ncbi:MAG: nucleotide exchange factor GrpE [Planctomycetota bacterium]
MTDTEKDRTMDEQIEETDADETSGTEQEEETGKEVTISFSEYEELKTLAEERDEYLDRLRRSVADRMKIQNRLKEIKKSARQEALRKVGRKVVPLADSLGRALNAAEEAGADEQIVEGLHLTEQEFYSALNELGIEPIEAEGADFDPDYHDAVFQQETDKVDPNTVLQEVKKGFLLGNQLLRPAQVVVSTAPEGESEDEEGQAER